MDPGFNSRRLGLTLNNVSPLSPSTSYNNHHPSPPRHKTHPLPVEIYSEIFLYTVQADPHSRKNLLLVDRHWHDIMLSTPGIHSQLRIYDYTRTETVEKFPRRWLIDLTVDRSPSNPYVDDARFRACIMAAADAASRWRSLALLSGEYEDFQIMHPLQHLESFKLGARCGLGNFLEPLITAITTTTTPRFTAMEIFHPDAARYLVQPAYFQFFSSLTTLRLSCRRMQEPVDILPSLHRLEIFEAHHLFFPIYSPGVNLPLTQILRVLYLKSVSVQWMAGRIFPALDECSIIFPHHADAIHSVYMPSCSSLKYHFNNLRTLEHFHHPPLARLEVKCGQWRTWTGNLQLATLHPIFAPQSLTCLYLEIRCSERLLAFMLGQAPALEELWMGLSSPHALSSAFFLAFAAEGRNERADPSCQTIAPLCRQLRKLHLHYKRWSRGAERNALIPAFGAIVASHPPKEQTFSFRLSFGEGLYSRDWVIHGPIERFDDLMYDDETERDTTFIGVSSPHGIVPLSSHSVGDFEDFFPKLEHFPFPRESEYISAQDCLELPMDYFVPFYSLKELRLPRPGIKSGTSTQFPPNAPLFHTLKVFDAVCTPLANFAGHTLHKLKRYREKIATDEAYPAPGPLIEMPVCTRLVAPLSRLATLRLPQIRELGVVINIDHDEPNYIWEQDIVLNANLSGLKLLHLCVYEDHIDHYTSSNYDIVEILASLPALETLVIASHYLVDPFDFFRALIPTNAQGTSELNQSSWEGQISGEICPRLKSLQIEGLILTEQQELLPVLKDVVSHRAITSSPLESFTFLHLYPRKKWELIGRYGGFGMRAVVPQEFRLHI